jgi:hypothetical protein
MACCQRSISGVDVVAFSDVNVNSQHQVAGGNLAQTRSCLNREQGYCVFARARRCNLEDAGMDAVG